jgi:hypothetical protein
MVRMSRRPIRVALTVLAAVTVAAVLAPVLGAGTGDAGTHDRSPAADERDWVRSGTTELAGLRIDDVRIDMGVVTLDETHVPSWTVNNPMRTTISFRILQPQVVLGCCPGPIVVDGTVVPPGTTVTVAAGHGVEVAFPLRMHAGMDGPHHLLIPIEVGDRRVALEVIGDFAATARS